MAAAGIPRPRVLVIEHEAGAGPGRVGRWLCEAGLELTYCRPYAGDEVPEAVAADGLLVLGGSPGPTDDALAPWLPATRALIRAAVSAEVPTWGICLGAQLLAVACGGEVVRGARGPEVGVHPIVIDANAAAEDAVFAGMAARVPAAQFHQEVISQLPSGAVRLAGGGLYRNQAFRVGSCAWGVQFHPEVGSVEIGVWAAQAAAMVDLAGREVGELTMEMDTLQDRMDATWSEVTLRWAQQVHLRAATTGAGGRVS